MLRASSSPQLWSFSKAFHVTTIKDDLKFIEDMKLALDAVDESWRLQKEAEARLQAWG